MRLFYTIIYISKHNFLWEVIFLRGQRAYLSNDSRPCRQSLCVFNSAPVRVTPPSSPSLAPSALSSPIMEKLLSGDSRQNTGLIYIRSNFKSDDPRRSANSSMSSAKSPPVSNAWYLLSIPWIPHPMPKTVKRIDASVAVKIAGPAPCASKQAIKSRHSIQPSAVCVVQ